MVIGTCVETLDSSGTALTATEATKGNHAMCHWMYAKYSVNEAVTTISATSNAWGDTKFLTTTQWGTKGGAITGANTKSSSGGTSLTLANNGIVYDPTPASGTTSLTARAYTMTWYQPKYASTYSASSLRRYNGGTNDGDKVKGYCVSTRLTAGTTHLSAGLVANTSAVTLSGAVAISAGAIALGVAALAF